MQFEKEQNMNISKHSPYHEESNITYSISELEGFTQVNPTHIPYDAFRKINKRGGGARATNNHLPVHTIKSRNLEKHRFKEKLRRNRVKERLDMLRELIPYSPKKDKISTLDNTIRYIQMLHAHIQMASMGAASSTSVAEIDDNPNLPTFLEERVENEASIFPWINHPTANNFESFDACLLGSPVMLMPILGTFTDDVGGHGIQNPEIHHPCGVEGGDSCVLHAINEGQ